MNLYQRFKSLFTKDNVAEMYYPGFDFTHGLAQLDDPLSMVKADTSWVYSLTNINASRVAGTPLRLYVAKPQSKKLYMDGDLVSKSKRKELSQRTSIYKQISDPSLEVIEIYAHPFLDLTRSVNPEMNEAELWHLSQKFEDLTGNNYWHIIDNHLGLPEQIWILPAQNMKIRPDPVTFVKEYIYNNGFKEFHIPAEDIIHFKSPSPLDVYYGRGPLAGAVGAANINIMMLQYEEALFKHGAMPSTYIDATGLTKAQAKELAALIKKDFKGPKKQGKMMVGMGKPTRLSFNPKDMNILIEGKPIKEQLASAFGVPMSMLGTDDVNLANANAGRMQYAETGLTPRLRMKEQKLNEQLLPRWDMNIFCAFDNVIPEDKEFTLKENDVYVKGGVWSVNEVRASQGKEPKEGGDELKISSPNSNEMSPEEAADIAKALEEAVMYELKKLDNKIDKVERDSEENTITSHNI